MKQLTCVLLLSLLTLGCARNESSQQAANTQPTNPPVKEKADPAHAQPVAPGPQTAVTISPETTRIVQPLDEEGYVDYIQALNHQASQGVTTANNFEVILRQTMDFTVIPEEIRSEYFQRIGIPVPAETAHFFQGFYDFAHEKTSTPEQEGKLAEEHDRIMTKPWKASEHPVATTWLENHGKYLDLVVEGSKRALYYAPYLSTPVDEEGPFMPVVGMLIPSAQQLRSIARGLAIRAMGRIATGNLQDAWNDLQAIRRISLHLGRRVTLIEGLVATAIDGIAFHAEIAVLTSPALTLDQCKQFLADLKDLPAIEPMVDKIDIGERFMGLDAVSALARYVQGKDNLTVIEKLMKSLQLIGALSSYHPPASNLITPVTFQEPGSKQPAGATKGPIDWDVTLQVLNSWYDKLVEANRAPTPQQRAKHIEKIEQELEELANNVNNPAAQLKSLGTSGSRAALGKTIGNVLVALLIPSTSAVQRTETNSQAKTILIRIGFAANAYQEEMGMPPSSLAELVPRYLASIPQDPHGGNAFRYAVQGQGFLVYSVGPNGTDDQGKTREDAEKDLAAIQPEWDDITIRVSK